MTKQKMREEMREKLIEDAEYLDILQGKVTTVKRRLLIIQARAQTVLAIMALEDNPNPNSNLRV